MPWKYDDPYIEAILPPEPIITIPIDDVCAWTFNPSHNWVYDRLRVALTQGRIAAPAGIPAPPGHKGLILKPIINLHGAARGVRYIPPGEQPIALPGHFWSSFCEPPHLSLDGVVHLGDFRLTIASTGIFKHPTDPHSISHWEVGRPRDESLLHAEHVLTSWCAAHLPDYRGPINAEIRSGAILEIHLRWSAEFFDLYPRFFFTRLETWKLRATKPWTLPPVLRTIGYSVPTTLPFRNAYENVRFGVTSVTQCSDPHRTGFINGTILEKCLEQRALAGKRQTG